MYITRKDAPNYASNNAYNEDVRVLVEELCQTEEIGPEGYIESDERLIGQRRFKNRKNWNNGDKEKEESTDKLIDNYLNHKYYQGLERKLLLALGWSTYSNIILTGALGSGKTALSNFMRKNMTKCISHESKECVKCHTKKDEVIEINFNTYLGDNCSDITEEFDDELYTKFKTFIEVFFKGNDGVYLKFCRRIIDNPTGQWESFFYSYVNNSIYKGNDEFYRGDLSRNVRLLLNWIQRKPRRLASLKLVGYILRFIKEDIYIKKACFLLIIDNIDQLPEICQNKILNRIFQLTEITKVKTLIPMRLTTFGWIASSASYSFGHIEMAGVTPFMVLISRLKKIKENLLNSKDVPEIVETIEPNHFKSFLKRIDLLIDLITSKKYRRFLDVFESISGNSIRRGLFVSERLFLNKCVSHNSLSPFEDDLTRAILLGENEAQSVNTHDSLVTNIFCAKQSDNNTLINLRILQVLFYFKQINKSITVNHLANHLLLFSDYSYKNIVESINTLINVRKRLIYVDGIGEYQGIESILAATSHTVNITYSGILYLLSLSKNLVYIQECFAAINWNTTQIPNSIDYGNLNERFDFIRMGLSIYLEEDKYQMREYILSTNKSNRTVNYLLINRLLHGVARSILNIYLTQKNNHEYVEKLLDWLNLLYLALSTEKEIFHRKNVRMEKLITRYENVIRSLNSKKPIA